MLEYCAAVGIDTILIERMDRWARKFSAGETLIEMCRQAKLHVYNCATGDELTDDDPDPVRTYTQRCTDVLEMYVRRYPELWLWMHRRWRNPAPGVETTDAAPTEGETAAQEDAL